MNTAETRTIAPAAQGNVELFARAFEGAPFAMVIVDAGGHYLHANPAACTILGYSADELRGRNFLSSLHPAHLDKGYAAFQRVRLGEVDAFETEQQGFHPSGMLMWLKLSVAAVRAGSEGLYYIAHLEDITERKQAEEEKQRLQEIVRRQEQMSTMGALVGGVAHEVRNPLFAITATIDAMENRLGNLPDYTRYVRVLRAEAARMTELMQRLLEYGKPASAEHAPGRLREVIAAALQISSLLARERHVSLQFFPGDPDVQLRMDAPRLTAAFQNLIDNAVQFSSPGSSVDIQLLRDGQRAICLIRDHGPGLTAGDEAKIFQPFFTRRPGGTGLGLSIVQKTVDEHGGTISAANHPDGGAVMRVEFPLDRG